MDSVLRQSKAMCPFLKSATPATLRALSTSVRPKVPFATSPCGGTMTKLQVYAQRCPVMGKALAIQTSRYGAVAGIRAHATKTGMAKIHTSANHEARAVDGPVFEQHDRGMFD